MNRFIKDLIVFGLIFFVFDKLFYIFLFLSPSLEADQRLESVISGNMNKNIIILGSSKGARDILAGPIEKSIGLSTYNLSYPGSNIEFHEFLLTSLLRYNKKPRLIILPIDDRIEIQETDNLIFRYDRLYPLIKYNWINNELVKRGEKNFSSKFLCLSRINKSNFQLRRKKFSALDSIDNYGSMPLTFEKENAKFYSNNEILKYNRENDSPSKIDAFLNFQKICRNNNINLLIVYCPNFYNQDLDFVERIKDISVEEVYHFSYDTTKIFYKNKNIYSDSFHLNYFGAKEFTLDIISYLKSNPQLTD